MQYTDNLQITSGYFASFDKLNTFLRSFLSLCRLQGVVSDLRSVYCRKAIIRLLVFAKFLEYKSVHHLIRSDYCALINCGKDVYYSVKNNININWRNVLRQQAKEYLSYMNPMDFDAKKAHQTPCLIVDDSDIKKCGKLIEMIGKIFSHKLHKYILGFKSLNLVLWTGKTCVNIDFSLHVEKRKDGRQGLTKKEFENRCSRVRKEKSHGEKRIKESLSKKTTLLIQMIKGALKNGIQAPYLLVDSWFFNSKLVAFVKQSPLDLISRVKLNNWNYAYEGKAYTIGQLIQKLKNHRKRKWSRKLRMHYVCITVEFKGHILNLHLYKPKKRGSKWYVLVSTKKGLSSIKVYELYQNRWSIEVTYKELKQHFGYGKSQSRDFSGQIADHTICLMAFNIMSTFKSINEYESIGALFTHVKQSWIRPSVMELFWQLIMEVANKISEIFDLDVKMIVSVVLKDNEILKIFNLNQLLLTTET